MKVIRGLREKQQDFRHPAVTLGNFDGVHLGHQRIFHRLREWAHAHDGESIVYTFEPHPLALVAPERAPKLISDFETKMALIEACGLDVVVCEPFTTEFSRMTPTRFVEEVIRDGLGARAVFVGQNYRFGSGRGGNIATLQDLGREIGFHVGIVEAVSLGRTVVSSTMIRGLIGRGEVRRAGTLLGRPFTLRGTVVSGAFRGRTLGFPTANLDTPQDLVPAKGVYAARVVRGDRILKGAVNIGTNPTFDGDGLTNETHLLDFEGDLYGESIALEFVERIREERTYDSPEALVAQVRLDVEAIRAVLASDT